MKILRIERHHAIVQLTEYELGILANAINETLEALEEWEFSTRVGAGSADVEALRLEIKSLLASLKGSQIGNE